MLGFSHFYRLNTLILGQFPCFSGIFHIKPFDRPIFLNYPENLHWGICIGIQRDSLIRVDIIDKKFSPKAMGIFRILYALSGVFVCAVLTIYSKTQIALGWTRSSDALQIPMAWIYIAMEIGYVLALLSAILKLLQEILSYCRMWRADKPMKGGDSL